MHSLVPGFHIWILAYVAMARCSPDGEYRTHWTSAPQSIGFPCCCHVFVFHSFVVLSYEPLAKIEPSGEKSSEQMKSWTLMALVRDSPLSPRQAMSFPFRSPLAINSPSRDTVTAIIPLVCPSIFFNRLPSFKFHRRSVLSLEPVTIRRPSGKTATACTKS